MFKNGATLPGTLTVERYDAFLDPPESPADAIADCVLNAGGPFDCFKLVYSNVVNGAETNPVAPKLLRWVQFICSNAPSPKANLGRCPPAQNAYIDPQPNDSAPGGVAPEPGGKPLPFYYREGGGVFGHDTFSGNLGGPPLTFLDKPFRLLPAAAGLLSWEARLYLVEWNGAAPDLTQPPGPSNPNGEVTIRDGVRWGFRFACLGGGLKPGTATRGGVDSNDRPGSETDGLEPPLGVCNATARGVGHGVAQGSNKGGIGITGSFSSADIDLRCPSCRVRVGRVLEESGEAGLLVEGNPLTLLPDPRNTETVAYFKTADGQLPVAQLSIRALGRDRFNFRLDVSQATINAPIGCPVAELASSFTMDDDGAHPVEVTTYQLWRCFGPGNQYLRTP